MEAKITIEDVLKNVKGEMYPVECYKLYELAKGVSAEHNIVELGTNRGLSLCSMGTGSKEGNGAKLTAVDLWDFEDSRTERFRQPEVFEDFIKNIEYCGLTDLVSYLKGSTDVMVNDWEGEIGLLHIDANHTYSGAKKDFVLWSPYVVDEGLILFHDYHEVRFPGVRKLVHELIDNGDIVKITQVEMLFVSRLIKRSE